ncbi:MAG: protein kinase [Deltaproteobacteria bacterium]|nr:protein kinase [Deltaproteobacteria bacterium]
MDDRGKVQSTVYGVGAFPVVSGPAVITRNTSPVVALPDLAPGTRIAQYELIRELGRGGMGVVYAARDLKLGRRVAMKFLKKVDDEVLDRFLVEARATAQCNHENIVIIYEVDEHEGMPYMVLEYLEGRSLRSFMGAFGDGEPIVPMRAVELVLPIARALARAGELGIVHRDLKPENVIVTSGQVKVLDFGIAKALGAKHSRARRDSDRDLANMTITREGSMVGTLPYMSPEQMGAGELDGRSDLYALGVIMFEMLTGRHPVDPLTPDAVLASLVSPTPHRSVRSLVPDLPAPLVQIVDDLLRKNKDERIASAAELVARLEDALPHRPTRKLADGESPYPGLTAFQEGDADRFFGRTRDVTRMVARIRELPLTGIVGPSGVGKSSFVRAGVAPALKQSGEAWDVITLRPGRQPIVALASAVERYTTRALGGAATDHGALVERLRVEPGYLGSLLRTRASATRMHVLLFVDQFEELYTLVADPAERRAFTAALAAIADDPAAPLRVVVSMRSDFLDRVGEDARFLEELSRGLVFLATPDRIGLREALEQPLALAGYRFETTAMLDDMLDALENTPGALPLLQFAAAKLWDVRDRERRMLTSDSYGAIGGVSGALAAHADEVVRALSASERITTQKILRKLVTPERTRAIVETAELAELGSDATRIVDVLVRARLLVVQNRDGGAPTVEIVHESLIERWPTLRRWLDDDHDDAALAADITAAAKQWDSKGRPAGLLWRTDALADARRWYTARPRQLAARDQAFLDAAFAAARRATLVRRSLVGAAFVVLAAFGAVATIGYVRVRDAEHAAVAQADKAAAEAKRATEAYDRVIAEQQKREAAERERASADEARLAAQVAEKQAQQAEAQKAADLAMSREELIKKNGELVDALSTARSAQTRAETATHDAQKARAELQQKLAAEMAKNEQLQRELKKVSTNLKD